MKLSDYLGKHCYVEFRGKSESGKLCVCSFVCKPTELKRLQKGIDLDFMRTLEHPKYMLKYECPELYNRKGLVPSSWDATIDYILIDTITILSEIEYENKKFLYEV
jgi:hypothetical protein